MILKKIKSYVNSKNNATVICLACNTARQISAAPYRHKRHAIKVNCRCGEKFELNLDFRRHYRKSVDLAGTYTITNPKKAGGGIIHIRNISRSGMGFTVSGRHNLKPDISVSLEFNLKDKKQTPIKKDANIMVVLDNHIGCEFFTNTPDDRALGFYLRA